MKKIDMKPFMVKLRKRDGSEAEATYPFKESMIEILFNPLLRLNSLKLLRQEELSKKIINNVEDQLLLEEEEYERVRIAAELAEGFTKNDIEFVHRIMNAETIEVEAKPPVEPETKPL